MMDCATFENRLTRLLAGELEPGAARAALAELEEHVRACPDCESAAGLVELAALPPAERDPVEEPPEGYWDGFDASVANRLQRSRSGRPGTWWRPLAAAAAIVLALAAGWILRGRVAPVEETRASAEARLNSASRLIATRAAAIMLASE